MTLVHDWYQVQAGAVDPRARSFKYDDELMGDLIRFVSSHEVGHTLGLRHNMGSSSFTPVEKLRDKEWVEKHGHTVSIMDYARFNYVAQPEDGIGKEGLYPRINDYDKWAIEYGYRPTEFKTPKEDHLYWNKVIIERLKDHPELWFGGEAPTSTRAPSGRTSVTTPSRPATTASRTSSASSANFRSGMPRRPTSTKTFPGCTPPSLASTTATWAMCRPISAAAS